MLNILRITKFGGQVLADALQEVYHDDTDFIANFWDNRYFIGTGGEIDTNFVSFFESSIPSIGARLIFGCIDKQKVVIASFDGVDRAWYVPRK